MRNWEGVQKHRAIRQTFPGAGRAQLNLFAGLRNSTCTTAMPKKGGPRAIPCLFLFASALQLNNLR